MPEVAVLRSAGDDQVVPGNPRGADLDGLPVEIDGGHPTQVDRDVLVPGELRADGHRDIRRIQARGGHLVEQRLEEMMVALVDEDDAHGIASRQRFRRRQATKAASHDERGLAHVRFDATGTHSALGTGTSPVGRLPRDALIHASSAPSWRRSHSLRHRPPP